MQRPLLSDGVKPKLLHLELATQAAWHVAKVKPPLSLIVESPLQRPLEPSDFLTSGALHLALQIGPLGLLKHRHGWLPSLVDVFAGFVFSYIMQRPLLSDGVQPKLLHLELAMQAAWHDAKVGNPPLSLIVESPLQRPLAPSDFLTSKSLSLHIGSGSSQSIPSGLFLHTHSQEWSLVDVFGAFAFENKMHRFFSFCEKLKLLHLESDTHLAWHTGTPGTEDVSLYAPSPWQRPSVFPSDLLTGVHFLQVEPHAGSPGYHPAGLLWHRKLWEPSWNDEPFACVTVYKMHRSLSEDAKLKDLHLDWRAHLSRHAVGPGTFWVSLITLPLLQRPRFPSDLVISVHAASLHLGFISSQSGPSRLFLHTHSQELSLKDDFGAFAFANNKHRFDSFAEKLKLLQLEVIMQLSWHLFKPGTFFLSLIIASPWQRPSVLPSDILTTGHGVHFGLHVESFGLKTSGLLKHW